MLTSLQVMGLNGWAHEFLAKNNESSMVHDEIAGLADNRYPLHTYYCLEGRVLVEVVQAEVWNSGPICFIALQEDGEWVSESVWSQDEIDLLVDHET